MTSIVKKVLRRGSGKTNGGKSKSTSSSSGTQPISPPSPDLTGLTPAEVSILKGVFKRQEEFENEEKGRQEKLTEDLASFEETVKRQASQKGALKHVDLRLCRLCYKTKFADGIGKACYDCHKRVCNRCGSYTRPKWNAKKNKSVKGKWRCNMCQMKRDVMAKTGIWYHGNSGRPVVSGSVLEKKLSISEMESSDNDGTGTGTSTDMAAFLERESLQLEDESEVFSGQPPISSLQRTYSRRSRHRSITSMASPTAEEADDDVDINDEQFKWERQLCRIQRHNRKCRRRLRSGSFSVSSEWDSERDQDQDSDKKSEHDQTSADHDRVRDRHKRKRGSLKRETALSSSGNLMSPELEFCEEEGFSKSTVDKVKPDTYHTHIDQIPVEFISLSDYFSSDSDYRNGQSDTDMRTGRPLIDRKALRRVGSDDSKSKANVRRHNHSHHTSSDRSSVMKHVLSDHGSYHSSPDFPILSKTGESLPSKNSPNHSDTDEWKASLRRPSAMHRHVTTSSTNSLSPDMALTRHTRRKPRRPYVESRKPDETHLENRYIALSPHKLERSVCDREESRNFLRSDGPANRRMTIALCANLQLGEADRYRAGSQTSKPHDIILHKDKADTSQRTRGLGMRVIGGKQGPTGNAGAYVTMVMKGGPADVQGISTGDLVVSWNGQSLVGVTYEEAQEIIHQSGAIVQLTMVHCLVAEEPVSPLEPVKKSSFPVIVRAATLDVPDSLHPPPGTLKLKKPKRRMLPKTPIEIKKEVRKITGKLWIQVDYDVKCRCILIVLLRGVEIWFHRPGIDEPFPPNPVIMFHLLPNRCQYEPKESEIRFNTSDPWWNETFIFPNITQEELGMLSLEVTVWDYKGSNDTFLGEILLDFNEARIDNTVQCYSLEDHDDNSSPLPLRKKSFSLSESSIVSPVTSLEASSLAPSRNPSPRSSLSRRGSGSQPFPITPAHDKMRELLGQGKVSPAGRDRLDFSSSAQSSPLHSPTSPRALDPGSSRRSSFTTMVRRKMSHAMARMSASLVIGRGTQYYRREDSTEEQIFNRSQSVNDVRRLEIPSPVQRRSFESQPLRFSLLAPPHPLSRSNSSADFFQDDADDPLRSPNSDRPAPEGDDITSLLGPGQVPPKPTFETSVCGDIKMGFMVSKGQLEIDIVIVTGLRKGGATTAPDTYVKTYLVEGNKTIQKKKTHTIKISFDPVFRKKVKYSACNIHGRCIKVNVWEKQKTFDKKQCLGETVVKLDSLDLSQHTLAWYKLFPLGSMDFGSNESLIFW